MLTVSDNTSFANCFCVHFKGNTLCFFSLCQFFRFFSALQRQNINNSTGI